MQVRMLLIRAVALGALAVSISCAAHRAGPARFMEPGLRALPSPVARCRAHRRRCRRRRGSAAARARPGPTADTARTRCDMDTANLLVRRERCKRDALACSGSGRSPCRSIRVRRGHSTQPHGRAGRVVVRQRPCVFGLAQRQVGSYPATAEAFSPDKDRVPVELQGGDNRVLLRFHETSAGPSQFSMRAVPPGSALEKMDEITPSLFPPTITVLAVRTHFAAEKDAAPVVGSHRGRR